MSEHKKNGRLRIELSARQKVWFGVLLAIVLGGMGYGWYYWKSMKAEKAAPKTGINMALPEAKLDKKDPLDKMAYYELARRDSAHRDTVGLSRISGGMGYAGGGDEQSRKINEKLASINQVLAAPPTSIGVGSALDKPGLDVRMGTGGAGNMGKDVDRLEALMKGMNSGASADPEMEQLGSVMDKLLVLQNPQLAGSLLKDKTTGAGSDGASGVGPVRLDSVFHAVPAVVSVNQSLKQGSVVELRLLDSLTVSGQVIPAGHLVYGLASFSNQRLNLEIKNIRLGTSIVPVNLTVFDRRDGMVGINAPDAMVRDAVSGGVSSASGSIGVTGFDLGTQLAGAGIDAARSLLNKKVSRVSQRLRAGYPLLLRDNSLRRR